MNFTTFLARSGGLSGTKVVPDPEGAPLIDVTSQTTQALGTFDDSQGTFYVEDGNGNKRAVSWSPDGYVDSLNGSVTDQYPPVWDDPEQDTPGNTYYIYGSGGGNDAADGLSFANAWETFTNLSSVSAGDTVLLREGRTFNLTLTPPVSGTATNVIKFGSYNTGTPGAKPVIDGQNTRTKCLDIVTTRSHLWFDNIDFYNGKPGWPGSDYEGMCHINSESDNIVFTDCEFHGSDGSGFGVGDNCTDLRWKDCKIYDNPGWGLSVRNYDGTKDASGLVFAGLEVYQNASQGDPLGSTGTEAIAGITADMQVYDCVFHDNNTSDHVLYRGWNDYESEATTGLCRIFNNIFDCSSGSVSFNSLPIKGRGGRAYRNQIYRASQYGIEVTFPTNVGAVTQTNLSYVHHNIMVDTESVTANGDSGRFTAGIQLSSPDRVAGTGAIDLSLWNNTIDDVRVGFSIGEERFDTTNGDFCDLWSRNNLVRNADVYPVHLAHAINSVSINNNYYTGSSTTWRQTGTNYTFANWITAGFDANSVGDGASPDFTDGVNADITVRNYGLGSSSPARGEGGTFTGADVLPVLDDPNSWIGINFVPHATSPDAGAYQYLSGKTLDASKKFLGLTYASSTFQALKLWSSPKTASELNVMTTPAAAADNAIWEDSNNDVYEDDNNAVWE